MEKEDQQDLQQQNQDEGEFQEIDLTPYEDDDDETLHRKLVLAKQARKQAEEDLRLLVNRIGLLKSEEGKAVRKIDETQKRTGEIIEQRQRNLQTLRQKQQIQKERELEEKMKAQEHRMRKEEQANRVMQRKNEAKHKTWSGAFNTKQEIQQNKVRQMQQKQYDEAKAQNINMMIRQAH